MQTKLWICVSDFAICFSIQNFLDAKFNGIDPEDIIFLMTLPDPQTSVASKAAQALQEENRQPIKGHLGYCYTYQSQNEVCIDSGDGPRPSDLFQAKDQGEL